MALVIRARQLFVNHYLKVTKWGVDYMETAGIGGRRKFKFGQIDFILISPTGKLSFQVGQEIFSIQTKPGKAKHTAAIQELTKWVTQSRDSTGGFPIVPVAKHR